MIFAGRTVAVPTNYDAHCQMGKNTIQREQNDSNTNNPSKSIKLHHKLLTLIKQSIGTRFVDQER